MGIGRRIPFGPPGVGPRVLLTVPTSGWLHRTVTNALLEFTLGEQRMHGDVATPTERPYEANLATIAADVVDKGYDFWCSFDDDNAPRTGNPLDLVLLDVDIIGCPTPVWHDAGKPGERPWCLNAYDEVGDGFADGAWKEHLPWDGLQEVDAVGTGCFVVARRVLEKLGPEAFMRVWRNGRPEIGNDLAFCYRAKRAGFRVWAHYGYTCRHVNELDLLEVIEAMGAVHG